MNARQQALLAFADRSMARPVKAKLRALEKRKMHRAQKQAMIKALNERDMLMRLWRKWRKDVYNEALDGPYQEALQELVDFLNQMNLKNEAPLLKLIHSGNWHEAHKDIRFLVTILVDAKITALREKQELPPFDDGLIDEPLTLFQKVRHMIEPQYRKQNS